jgi:hypothetical protein
MTENELWYVQRKRELEAAAPVKRKKVEPFVKVPLWWIVAAAKATRSPATLVMIELLRASWKARSLTFPLPNSRLQRIGVNRETKRRVLRALEGVGLIRVNRLARKTPIVTLLSL